MKKVIFAMAIVSLSTVSNAQKPLPEAPPPPPLPVEHLVSVKPPPPPPPASAAKHDMRLYEYNVSPPPPPPKKNEKKKKRIKETVASKTPVVVILSYDEIYQLLTNKSVDISVKLNVTDLFALRHPRFFQKNYCMGT